MGKPKKWWFWIIVLVAAAVISIGYLSTVNIPILQPKGIIADKEFRLLVAVVLIMCIVVVPVFIMLGYIVWKYRDSNHSPKQYTPDVSGNRKLEGLWWLIPSIIIAVLSVITWNASYALNPYKPIPSRNRTLPVEVIALDWKWLFIYPTKGIASVNDLRIPVNTPVHFYLTSDTVMNSFWIPQLSGQIYDMPGMQTQLFVMADQPGDYKGWSANISGIGFASMMFNVHASSSGQFNLWVNKTKYISPKLNLAAYNRLAKPSMYVKPQYYSSPEPNLFYRTITKYMFPAGKGMNR